MKKAVISAENYQLKEKNMKKLRFYYIFRLQKTIFSQLNFSLKIINLIKQNTT